MDIKIIAQNWLNGKGYTLPEGYSIENHRETPISAMESVGIITLRNLVHEIVYRVDYKALTSLHGSGSDDLYEITKLSVVFPTT